MRSGLDRRVRSDVDARRGLKRYLRKGVVFAGALVVFLATLELSLWALGSVISRGIDRESRNSTGSGETEFTILCIGDSWTEGAPTGRYPTILVDSLNRDRRGVRFRQVNAGRSGTNSSQALRQMPDLIARHEPDLLLVMTGNNDHHNLTASTYWKFEDDSLGWGSILRARARITMHSLRTYRLARLAWHQATGSATSNEFFFPPVDGNPTDRAGLIAIDLETHRRQLEYNLTRFVELAQMHDIPIVFQTYFHFHGYRVNEIIRDVALRHRVPLVDHNRLFHTRVPAERRESYRIPDGHPNVEGYTIMAEWIAEVLDEHELLPRPDAHRDIARSVPR